MIEIQKQPNFKKKSVAQFKMANVKKTCEIKGGGQEVVVMV